MEGEQVETLRQWAQLFEGFCFRTENGVVGGKQSGVKRSYLNAEILAYFYVDENDSVDWK